MECPICSKHTAVLVLGCLLVALVMACGGGPSEAEIEATVVARIDEKQAEDAALETMAKAMLEATAQAVPTATPLPPTPTLTPTPTPTPNVQATVQALVVAVMTALPTPTPISTSPSAAPAPAAPAASAPSIPDGAVRVINKDPGGSGKYEFDPAKFAFEVGQEVTFAVTAETEFHTFNVDELGIDVSMDAGETKVFTFTFHKAGVYKLFCIPHESLGMVGEIVVR